MELLCQNYVQNCQKIGCEPTKSILNKINNKDNYKGKNDKIPSDILDLSSISTTLNVNKLIYRLHFITFNIFNNIDIIYKNIVNT